MSEVENELHNGSTDDSSASDRGGFVALAVLAAALGAGAAVLLAPDQGSKTRRRVTRKLRGLRGGAGETIGRLQREIRRRKSESRREKRIIALAGLLIGAGIASLLSPESGPEMRGRLGGTLKRIKVGAIDRIERLRPESEAGTAEPAQAREVPSVQELGRDPNTVF
ncbi:MAG TPA: YtxH domain-containing protein [Gemmatimonadales bacterium]|nr:YtxH domain-containing protein [Gemmatimonadales bacterium]